MGQSVSRLHAPERGRTMCVKSDAANLLWLSRAVCGALYIALRLKAITYFLSSPVMSARGRAVTLL